MARIALTICSSPSAVGAQRGGGEMECSHLKVWKVLHPWMCVVAAVQQVTQQDFGSSLNIWMCTFYLWYFTVGSDIASCP